MEGLQLAGIVLAVPLRLSSPQMLISMHSLLTGLYIPFCPAHQQLPTHQSSPKSTSLMLCAHTCESPPMLLFAHQLRCARAAQVCSLLTSVLACTGQCNSACNLQQDLNVLEVSSPAFLKVFACCEADADEHRGGTDRKCCLLCLN